MTVDIRKRFFSHLAQFIAAPAARHRYVMLSEGTVLYSLLCEELCRVYGTRTATQALKKITRVVS